MNIQSTKGKISILCLLIFASFNFANTALAQFQSPPVKINYKLSVDTNDLSRYHIEMRIKNITKVFSLAMAAHPEYDDRFWRYVKNFRVVTDKGDGHVIKADSSLWNISINSGVAVIHYDIELPLRQPGQRGAWQPFLTKTGGLVGELHSFMFIPGKLNLPAIITMDLPSGWKAATSLQSGDKPGQYFTYSFAELSDAPILIGKFHTWYFETDNIPHEVCYFSENKISFDSVTFTGQIKKITEAARALFGRLPYKKYYFLLQDNAYGALEHANSLPAGASATQIAEDPKDILQEIAHEYFHAWNLVRIKPVEWNEINYTTPKLAKTLWWGEGITLYYADLLLRRAHLPVYDSTRKAHLASLLNQYYNEPGFNKYSAEKISEAANGPNGMLGDYPASTHVQGEILGTLLDIMIRDKTKGRKSADDVMRKLMLDYGDKKGITSADIQRTIGQVSGINIAGFFKDHVYGSRPIDFNKYLQPIGLMLETDLTEATNEEGIKLPDTRIYVWKDPGKSDYRIQVLDPQSPWAKAGIHTGDTIISLNNKSFIGNRELFGILSQIKIGDSISVKILKENNITEKNFVLTGYKKVRVFLKENTNINSSQRKLFEEWAAGITKKE